MLGRHLLRVKSLMRGCVLCIDRMYLHTYRGQGRGEQRLKVNYIVLTTTK